MAMPTLEFPLNISIRQGVDYQFIMVWYDDDDVTPTDLENAKISLTVKPAFDEDDTDAAAYVTLDTADFTVDEDPDGPVNGTKNRISAVIPRATTQVIPIGLHYVDLDIILPGSTFLNTYGSGRFEVKAQYGRREPTSP